MAAQFKNAPFLADLLSVLNHPATAAPPDLRHFRLDAATVARQRAEAIAATRAAKNNQSALAWALLAGWVVALVTASLLWRSGASLPLRARRVALLVIPAALVTVSAGLHARPVSAPATAATGLIRPAGPLGPAAAPQSVFVSAPAWQELVAVEHQLAVTQDTLARQEAQIRVLAAVPSAPSPPAPASPTETPAAEVATRGAAGDFENPAQRRVARLLSEYETAVSQYQETLKREYDIYRGAAQDPAKKQEIVTAAATVPRPEVKDVVAYNLALVQARIDQENAITAAEARLQAIGSLSGAQLNAIRHHQAFIIPVEAPVIQGFGPTDFGLEPAVNYRGAFYPHFHTGIDIVGAENSPVHAAADGVVLLANSSQDGQGHYTGYGNYVVIAHPDGFVTLYGHLNAFSVKAGDVVHQGQIVGQEGSTGMSTGPHVHFEIRHNGEWVDPMPYLTGQANT